LLGLQETLCGYIKDNVQEYLENHWDATECKTDVEALCEQVSRLDAHIKCN